MEVAYQIPKYLKSSPRKGILFRKGGKLEVKLGWGYPPMDGTHFFGSNFFTWRSKKQSIINQVLKQNLKQRLKEYINLSR